MPRVSVCIPTYNCAAYLQQAIESVLRQRFTDFELVICDDASTDETPDLCHHYSDSRMRYIRFEENAGQAGNFNRCFEMAQGDLFTLLSADDYFLPDLLADQIIEFDRHPEIGFSVGATQIINAEGTVTSINSPWSEDLYFGQGELVGSLLFGAAVNTLSLVFRRKYLDDVGLFRTDLTWGHDWEWILRLAEKCAGCYVNKPLAAYRVHDSSGTAEQLSAAKNGFQERRILQDTFARLAANGNRFPQLKRPAFAALSRRHMYFAEQALLSERRAVARNNLWYAALADASMIVRPTYWALLFGSVAPINLYNQYRTLRGSIATPVR